MRCLKHWRYLISQTLVLKLSILQYSYVQVLNNNMNRMNEQCFLVYIYSYGNCVPFNSSSTRLGTPCDELFQQGVDYVYMPYTRKGGQLRSYLQFLEDVYIAFQLAPDLCKRQAQLGMCHYFLPPCGNSTVFEPPTPVCDDICNHIHDLCPVEFEFVVQYFEQRPRLVEAGLTFINCSNTGEYLEPLPYCCSDVGISIRKCMKYELHSISIPVTHLGGFSHDKIYLPCYWKS